MRKLLALLLLLPGLAHGAITYIGAGTASNATDGGAVTPAVHASTTNGDLILCLVGQKNGTDYTILTSTGYTQLYGRNGTLGHSAIALLGKIATGSDSVSVDSSDNTAGRTVIGQCATFRGTLNTVTGIVSASAGTDNAAQAVLNTPALTVTDANTLVVVGGIRDHMWNTDNPGPLSTMTEIGQPDRTSSAQAALKWDYVIQTTAANISADTTTWASTLNTAEATSIIVSLKPAVVAPTWSVSPTVSAQDDNDYTLSYTPSTSATFYAVACAKDETAPTIAQVKAAHCTGDAAAIASVNEAVTGADTTVLGGSLTRPVHDLYAVLSNAGGDSTLATLADECLDAAAGKTIVNCPSGLTSIHANSPINGFNAAVTPDIVAGDIMVADSTTDLGDALTWTATGLYSYDGNSARRKFSSTFYDDSAKAMHADTMQVCVNNQLPIANPFTEPLVLVKDVPFAAYDFAHNFSDADDSTLTITTSDTGTGIGTDKRPAGTTTTGGVFDDTGSGPTSANGSTGSFTATATDSCGESVSIDIPWEVHQRVTVPDCYDDLLSSCLTDMDAESLSTSFSSQCSATVASLHVISQTPAAGTVVDPFSSVSLIVSAGVCTGISPLPTEFLPDGTAVPASAIFRSGAAYSMTGVQYVALMPGDGVTVSHRGLRFRPDGALVISVGGTIRTYTRGIGQTNAGEVVAATCSPNYVVDGVPMDQSGTVCMTDVN